MRSISNIRLVGAIIVALFAILVFPSILNAQVVKNVRFAIGKYSASYRGNLPRNYADYDAYVFRARRGQTLTFKLTTVEPDAWVTVYETQDEIDPTEDIVPASIEYPRSWSGKLPVTSEYSVQVYGARRDGGPSKRSAYTITITILNTAAIAQANAKRPPLPANLAKYVGEYPVELMKVPSVKSRLKTLLGKRFQDFDYSISVQATMKMEGDFLFASGCMAHACTIMEAAFVIDVKNKRIHAVIYDKDKPPAYFNEDKAPTPQVLIDWVAELKAG